ncbi:UNVERIFIED_CONTAM: hypothetical protein HDU68_011209 [Siphonaria sp. JEL0065]|nr:hypothetical protein HDU68_011209 [Siphonaria sp. JEL0065]
MLKGCPTPKLALYGILTTPREANIYRQHNLRAKYAQLSTKLPVEQQIDFLYVFGETQNITERARLNLELALFPHTTVILNRVEAMNDGKTYDWFCYARSIMYSPHPTEPNTFCPRYVYIGKTDDDTIIHLPRFSKELLALPTDKPSYIGRYMAGELMMGQNYLLSASLVEYIATSEAVSKKIVGPEDVVLAEWIKTSGIDVNIVNYKDRIHDIIGGPNWSSWVITNETLSIHFCKTTVLFWKCMDQLFSSDDVDLKEAISKQSKSLGLYFTEKDMDALMVEFEKEGSEWKKEYREPSKLEDKYGVYNGMFDRWLLRVGTGLGR